MRVTASFILLLWAHTASAWQTNGLLVCGGVGNQEVEWSCPDGAGGAFLAWSDDSRPESDEVDLYLGRLDGQGNLAWGQCGILVAEAVGFSTAWARVIPDDVGGVILTWCEGSESPYALRFDPDGNALWAQSVRLSSFVPMGYQVYGLVPDDEGGAIVIWRI